jgi:Flp pilus assembly pilin Flp
MIPKNFAYLRTRLGLGNRAEVGQGLVEYGLVIVLISIAAIVAMVGLAGGINGLFTRIVQALGA